MIELSAWDTNDKESVRYASQLNFDLRSLSKEEFFDKHAYYLTAPENVETLNAVNDYYRDAGSQRAQRNLSMQSANKLLRNKVKSYTAHSDGGESKLILPEDEKSLQELAGLAFLSYGIEEQKAADENLHERLFGVRGVLNVGKAVAENIFNENKTDEYWREQFHNRTDEAKKQAAKILYGDEEKANEISNTDMGKALFRVQSKTAIESALEDGLTEQESSVARLVISDSLTLHQKARLLSSLPSRESIERVKAIADARRALNDDMLPVQMVKGTWDAMQSFWLNLDERATLYLQGREDFGKDPFDTKYATPTAYSIVNNAAREEGYATGLAFLKNADEETLKRYGIPSREKGIIAYEKYQKQVIGLLAANASSQLSKIKPVRDNGWGETWGYLRQGGHIAAESAPYAALMSAFGPYALVVLIPEAYQRFYNQAIEENWNVGEGALFAGGMTYGVASQIIEMAAYKLPLERAFRSKIARFLGIKIGNTKIGGKIGKAIGKAGKVAAKVGFGENVHLTNAQLILKKNAQTALHRIVTVLTRDKRAFATEAFVAEPFEEILDSTTQNALGMIIDPTTPEGKKLYNLERLSDEAIQSAWDAFRSTIFLMSPMHVYGNLRGGLSTVKGKDGKDGKPLIFATQEAVKRTALADSVQQAWAQGIDNDTLLHFMALSEDGRKFAIEDYAKRHPNKKGALQALKTVNEYETMLDKETGEGAKHSNLRFGNIFIPSDEYVKQILLSKGYIDSSRIEGMSPKERASIWLSYYISQNKTDENVISTLTDWFKSKHEEETVPPIDELIQRFLNENTYIDLFGADSKPQPTAQPAPQPQPQPANEEEGGQPAPQPEPTPTDEEGKPAPTAQPQPSAEEGQPQPTEQPQPKPAEEQAPRPENNPDTFDEPPESPDTNEDFIDENAADEAWNNIPHEETEAPSEAETETAPANTEGAGTTLSKEEIEEKRAYINEVKSRLEVIVKQRERALAEGREDLSYFDDAIENLTKEIDRVTKELGSQAQESIAELWKKFEKAGGTRPVGQITVKHDKPLSQEQRKQFLERVKRYLREQVYQKKAFDSLYKGGIRFPKKRKGQEYKTTFNWFFSQLHAAYNKEVLTEEECLRLVDDLLYMRESDRKAIEKKNIPPAPPAPPAPAPRVESQPTSAKPATQPSSAPQANKTEKTPVPATKQPQEAVPAQETTTPSDTNTEAITGEKTSEEAPVQTQEEAEASPDTEPATESEEETETTTEEETQEEAEESEANAPSEPISANNPQVHDEMMANVETKNGSAYIHNAIKLFDQVANILKSTKSTATELLLPLKAVRDIFFNPTLANKVQGKDAEAIAVLLSRYESDKEYCEQNKHLPQWLLLYAQTLLDTNIDVGVGRMTLLENCFARAAKGEKSTLFPVKETPAPATKAEATKTQAPATKTGEYKVGDKVWVKTAEEKVLGEMRLDDEHVFGTIKKIKGDKITVEVWDEEGDLEREEVEKYTVSKGDIFQMPPVGGKILLLNSRERPEAENILATIEEVSEKDGTPTKVSFTFDGETIKEEIDDHDNIAAPLSAQEKKALNETVAESEQKIKEHIQFLHKRNDDSIRKLLESEKKRYDEAREKLENDALLFGNPQTQQEAELDFTPVPVQPVRTQAAPTQAEVENATAQQQAQENNTESPKDKFSKSFRELFTNTLSETDEQAIKRLDIVRLRKLAEECGWTDASDIALQEAVELELVKISRNIAQEMARPDTSAQRKAELRAALLKLYKRQPTISRRSTNRVELQQYSTPLPLAAELGVWAARNGAHNSVLEPTAGNGALTIAFPAGNVHVNEIDNRRVANLQAQGFGRITTQNAADASFEGSYDVIVANPPFGSTPKTMVDTYPINQIDHKIAINALNAMSDNGQAAIIIGGHTEYFGVEDKFNKGKLKSDRGFLGYLYSHYNVIDVINIDGKLYAKQGTTFPIRVILIKGRKSAVDENIVPPNQEEARAETLSTWEEIYARFDESIVPPQANTQTQEETPPTQTAATTEQAESKPNLDEWLESMRNKPTANETESGKQSAQTETQPAQSTDEQTPTQTVPATPAETTPPSAPTTSIFSSPNTQAEAVPPSRKTELEDALNVHSKEDIDREVKRIKKHIEANEADLHSKDASELDKKLAQERIDRHKRSLNDLQELQDIYDGKTTLAEAPTAEAPTVETPTPTVEANATAKDILSSPVREPVAPPTEAEINSTIEDAADPDNDNNGRAPVPVDVEKVGYPAQSKARQLQSVVPAGMAKSLAENLQAFGDIDTFLCKELGYASKEELYKALSAEQVDGVAMAIKRLKENGAFINSDMTGVGKGRQAASIIRWAVKNGKQPIFLTAKPKLFSDIWRDLNDIGSGHLRPLIVNSEGSNPRKKKGEEPEYDEDGNEIEKENGNDARITDKDGKEVFPSVKDLQKNKIFADGKLPAGFDFVCATYSQFSTNTGLKPNFIQNFARDNIVILDEAHMAAGGLSNTAVVFSNVVLAAKSVAFFSATYAKRPDNMPLFAMRTGLLNIMGEDASPSALLPKEYQKQNGKKGVALNEDTKNFLEIIKSGGVPMQELISAALTESGELVRRERDFTGVKVDWVQMEGNSKEVREKYDACLDILRDIIAFQKDYVDDALVEFLNGQDNGETKHKKNETVRQRIRALGYNYTPFASRMFQVTNQLMLALKADFVAKRAIEEIKKGKKVIITLDNTLEGVVAQAAGTQEVDKLDFSIVIKNALKTTLKYTSDNGRTKTDHYFDVSKLDPEGQMVYEALEKRIEKFSAGLPLSPIDEIIDKLTVAGLRVGELTGRKTRVEKQPNGKYKVVARTETDHKPIIRKFQAGDIDVAILNKSASTGVSLHADVRAKDQRPRVMIVAQAQLDVNDEVQMRGRIDRTGQVHRGEYQYIVSDIPAEQRLLMMLKRKLSSLDANTTSNQKSKFNEVQVDDFINEYGDEVVVEFLKENPELTNQIYGLPEKFDKAFTDTGTYDGVAVQAKDAEAIMKCIALLPIALQEQFISGVSARYREYINYLNSTGQNTLEMKVLPLKATVKSKETLLEGDDTSKNAFKRSCFIETVEADRVNKPLNSRDIKRLIDKTNEGLTESLAETYRKVATAAINAALEKFDAQSKIKRAELEERLSEDDELTDTEKADQLVFFDDTQKERRKKLAQKTSSRWNGGMAFASGKVLSTNGNGAGIYVKAVGIPEIKAGTILSMPLNLKPNTLANGVKEISTGLSVSSTPVVFCGYKFPKNKPQPSKIKAVFATLYGQEVVELAVSHADVLDAILFQSQAEYKFAGELRKYKGYDLTAFTMETWDEKVATMEMRVTEKILTGNVVKAMMDPVILSSGELVRFSRDDGTIDTGIVVKSDNMEKAVKNIAKPVNDAERKREIREYIDGTTTGTQRTYINRDAGIRLKSEYISRGYSYIYLTAQTGKSSPIAWAVWHDKKLKELCENPKDGFVSSGMGMMAKFSDKHFDAIMDRLAKLGVKSRGIDDEKGEVGNTLAQRVAQNSNQLLSKDDTLLLKKLLGGWIDGVNVNVLNDTEFDEVLANSQIQGEQIFDNGEIIGLYDETTGQVYVRENSRVDTIVHELGGHATWQWAKENEPALFKKLEAAAKNAPESVKKIVRERYGNNLPEDVFLKECFAVMWEADLTGSTEALLKNAKEQTWWDKLKALFVKAWRACVRGFKGRAGDLNIDDISNLTPEEAVSALQEAFMNGKRLGAARTVATIYDATHNTIPIRRKVLTQTIAEEENNEYREALLKKAYVLAPYMLAGGVKMNGRIDGEGIDRSLDIAKKIFPNATEELLRDALIVAKELADPILEERQKQNLPLCTKEEAKAYISERYIDPLKKPTGQPKPISETIPPEPQREANRRRYINELPPEIRAHAAAYMRRREALRKAGRLSKTSYLKGYEMLDRGINPLTIGNAALEQNWTDRLWEAIKKEHPAQEGDAVNPDALNILRETLYAVFQSIAKKKKTSHSVAVSLSHISDVMRAEYNTLKQVLQAGHKMEFLTRTNAKENATNNEQARILKVLKPFHRYSPTKLESKRKTQGWTDYFLHRCYRCIQFRDPYSQIADRVAKEQAIIDGASAKGDWDSPEVHRARLALAAYALMTKYYRALGKKNIAELTQVADTLERYRNGGDEAFEKTLEAQATERDAFLLPLVEAMKATGDKHIDKTTSKEQNKVSNKLLDSQIDGYSIKQRFLDLIKYCADENTRLAAEDVVNALEKRIAIARQKYNNEYHNESKFYIRTLNKFFGKEGIDFNNERELELGAYSIAINHSIERQEFAKFSADGETPLTLDELMGIYSMIRQEDVQRPFVNLDEEQIAALDEEGKTMLRRIKQLPEIEEALGGKDGKCIRFIDAISAHYAEKADALDEVAVAVNGVPISMRTGDYNPVMRKDQYRHRFLGTAKGGQSVMPSVLTPRVVNQHDIAEHIGFSRLFITRAHDVAHFKAFGTMNVFFRNVFAQKQFYETMLKTVGKARVDMLQQHIEHLLAPYIAKEPDSIRPVTQFFQKVAAYLFLGFNISPAGKQTSGIFNFVDDIGYRKLIRTVLTENPFSGEAKKDWEEIKQSAGFQMRWGNARSIQTLSTLFEQHNKNEKTFRVKDAIANGAFLGIKLGDKLPSFLVGFPIYRAYKRKLLGEINPATGNVYTHEEAQAEALAMFLNLVDATQQPNYVENKAATVRNGDAFGTQEVQFKSADIQLFSAERSTLSAAAHAGFKNKRLNKKAIRVLVRAHVITPAIVWSVAMLVQLITKGELPDEDDLIGLLVLIATGGLRGWIFVGSIITVAIGTALGENNASLDAASPAASATGKLVRRIMRVIHSDDAEEALERSADIAKTATVVNQVSNVVDTYITGDDKNKGGRRLK